MTDVNNLGPEGRVRVGLWRSGLLTWRRKAGGDPGAIAIAINTNNTHSMAEARGHDRVREALK